MVTKYPFISKTSNETFFFKALHESKIVAPELIAVNLAHIQDVYVSI